MREANVSVIQFVDCVTWYHVDEYKPPQKTLLMITGPSGYRTHQQFLTLAYVDDDYRPPIDGRSRWINVQNDAVTDQFPEGPTHWAMPMKLPTTGGSR